MSLKQPKILVFTVSAWNSKVGANTWATLLEDYGSENVANICIRDEIPDSPVCSRYFYISENKILKSIFNRKIKTGQEVKPLQECEIDVNKDLAEHKLRYQKYGAKRRYSLLMVRELAWKLGKWKTKELDAFWEEFQPDIILYSLEGYIHFNRLVRYAIAKTGARAVGYVWDDNFTYKQSKKLGYKFYRYFQRKSLKKLARKTSEFFAITPKTKREADAFFGIDCTVLSKPLNALPIADNYAKANKPLKMLYTGNLGIGRDKTLAKLSSVLKEINKDEKNILLDVYTQTALSEEYLRTTQHEFCNIYSAISQKEVLQKQKEAEVLLFLEDLTDSNLTARVSFSTKITDYLSTGKCIFAIGNADLAPIEYFVNTNSAIVIDNEQEILQGLQRLLNKETLRYFSKNSAECGIANHNMEYIRKTFDEVLNRAYKAVDKEGK